MATPTSLDSSRQSTGCSSDSTWSCCCPCRCFLHHQPHGHPPGDSGRARGSRVIFGLNLTGVVMVNVGFHIRGTNQRTGRHAIRRGVAGLRAPASHLGSGASQRHRARVVGATIAVLIYLGISLLVLMTDLARSAVAPPQIQLGTPS